jgi:hypothetical protein
MENGGGGKGDVPQDANERKKLTSLRPILDSIISSSSPSLLWVRGRFCGRLGKERGGIFPFDRTVFLSKLGSRVLVEYLNMTLLGVAQIAPGRSRRMRGRQSPALGALTSRFAPPPPRALIPVIR